MKTSAQNTQELQAAFDASPFDDIKLFVEPHTKVSAEACTAEVLKVMGQLSDLHSGKKKAERTF